MPAIKKKFPYSTLIVPLIVLAGAVYLVIISWQGLGHDFVEHGWKTAPAVILDPDLKLPGKTNAQRQNDGIEQTINYEYVIGGRTYQSNSVSREITVNKNEYPAGKNVEIYYNPADESDAVLVRTPVQKFYLMSLIVMCLGVSGFIVYSLVRGIQKFNNS